MSRNFTTDQIKANAINVIREVHAINAHATLVAASKAKSVDAIRAAIRGGIRHFGENYVQEALPKIVEVCHPDIVWHFLGKIQSNKTQAIAAHFDWAQSVDRVKIANRLNAARSKLQPDNPLNVCIQVDLDAEDQKAGVAPKELEEVMICVNKASHLSLRGLMAIPKPHPLQSQVADSVSRLQRLFNDAAPIAGAQWDTLSIGMTADFKIALRAGSTMVRIGTAIFGVR